MNELIYKIKVLDRLGFHELADKIDSELIKTAQLLPPTQPFMTLPPAPVVGNSAPLNDFETAQLRKILIERKMNKPENNTDVLSPGAQNNQNQTTVDKRLNDLFSKYLTLDKKSKNMMDKFPPILSENEIQSDDISENTRDIDNLFNLVGNNEPTEPEE